jgi:hypothetical protein
MSLEREVVEGKEGPNQALGETLIKPEVHSLVELSKDQNTMDINPLLKPACDEIKGQLRRLRERLSNDHREAGAALQAAKKKRTELGDLLGQLQSIKTRQEENTSRLDCDFQDVVNLGKEASKELAVLHEEGGAEAALTALKRAKIDSLQIELNKVTSKMQYSEGLNANETSELAATQRAAWCADERAQRALLQNRQRDVIIQQLRTNIEQMDTLAASDRAAAELHSIKQQAKLAELMAGEQKVAAVKKEAKLLHNRWENTLIKLRKVDEGLEKVISQREDTEQKISAAKREAAKLREEQGVESQDNWKRGHAVNRAINRSKEAEKRILEAEESLQRVLKAQKSAAAATAEVVATLLLHEAARKEAEAHNEELLIQKQRVAAANNLLEIKLFSLLEAQCQSDSSLQATQQELRAAKIATVEKTAEIADLETDISKLQAALELNQGDLDGLNHKIKKAEEDVRVGLVEFEALQQQIDGIFKSIEQCTRDLQLLNKRKQEREEAGKEENGVDSLCVEINRLKKELAATGDGNRTAQANWSQAQERLRQRSQRHFQLRESLADAEKKLEETFSSVKSVLKTTKVSKTEVGQLEKKLESLQKEISRLDVGLDDMAKLEAAVEIDLTSQQTKHSSKLNLLQKACSNKENTIVAALKQRTKAATDASAADTKLQEIRAQKKAKAIQIEENRNLLKGEVKEATVLQGQAAALRRKLSAAYKRRNTAAVLLQKAAVASGIDSSDRYAGVIKRKNSADTMAQITAAKQRLEALRCRPAAAAVVVQKE